MRTYATAQLIGDRSHQCDATAIRTSPSGARAHVLLDGIGSTDAIRDWTRTAARRLASVAAHRGDAEAGLRAVYDRYAAEPDRYDPWQHLPSACAVVAVTRPGRPMTVAWCGDSRAYLLVDGELEQLTVDHNMRQVRIDQDKPFGPYSRNQVTSYLGSTATEPEPGERPLLGSVTRPAKGRLLLASDGGYEPLEDSCRDLTKYLDGSPSEAARAFTRAAIDHASAHADNATVLVADIRPAADRSKEF